MLRGDREEYTKVVAVTERAEVRIAAMAARLMETMVMVLGLIA
jgi:hypothetical protein